MARQKKVVRTEAEKATLRGMHQVISMLLNNPGIPMPWMSGFNIYVNDAAGLMAAAKHVPGKLDKKVSDGTFYLRKEFAGGVKFDINVSREQICTKRVTGTKIVPGYVVPDQTVETVEWDCPPALSALVAQTEKE